MRLVCRLLNSKYGLSIATEAIEFALANSLLISLSCFSCFIPLRSEETREINKEGYVSVILYCYADSNVLFSAFFIFQVLKSW